MVHVPLANLLSGKAGADSWFEEDADPAILTNTTVQTISKETEQMKQKLRQAVWWLQGKLVACNRIFNLDTIKPLVALTFYLLGRFDFIKRIS